MHKFLESYRSENRNTVSLYGLWFRTWSDINMSASNTTNLFLSISNHISEHNGERPCTCNYCDRTFRYNSNLSVTMKYTPVRSYFCARDRETVSVQLLWQGIRLLSQTELSHDNPHRRKATFVHELYLSRKLFWVSHGVETMLNDIFGSNKEECICQHIH